MRMKSKGGGPKRVSRTEAAGVIQEFPMPVAQFLAGDYLQRADVILTRRHGSLMSWLIRFATKSQFSHAALVFLVPARESEFNNTFVIESGTSGVDLTNLADYLNDRTAVVAIKRFRSIPPVNQFAAIGRREWFDEHVQRLVRGRTLNKIKSTYSYRTVLNIVGDLVDQALFSVSERMRGRRDAMNKRRKRGTKPPNAFICSGLVQLGYIEAVAELVGEGRLPPYALKEVIFDPEISAFLPDDWSAFTPEEIAEIASLFIEAWREELEAIKPVDLAQSIQLEWQYVMVDGWAHRVACYEETYELLKWSPENATSARKR